jgi:outer membrane protein
MKNLSTILSALALVGVIVLFALHFSSNKSAAPTGNKNSAASNSAPAISRVAYINIDTFEANYTLLKAKKEEFKKRQAGMEAELQASAQRMQKDYVDLQRKYQAQQLSEGEGEAAQKRLAQMQQSLETRKQSMEQQFMKDQEAFNNNLHDQLDSFLTEYNKTKHYDYILSYSRSNPVIMYADKGLNITDDVLKGMNERAASTK